MFTITPPPPHLVWEGVGSEVVIYDTTSHTTHHLTGDIAQAFLAAVRGEEIDPQEVITLQDRGFLEPHSPISRRTLMAAGVTGVGLGITSLALPSVAAASSTGPKTDSAPPEQSDPEPDTPPPPQPTILAADLTPGDWRWSVTSQLVVNPTNTTAGLPQDGTFVVGEEWELSLDGFDGPPVEADVRLLGVAPNQYLSLRFQFPLTGGVTAPSAGTTLTGTLTKVDDRTVFSEPFPISA